MFLSTLFYLLTLSCLSSVPTNELHCKVISVTDGDTFKILQGKKKVAIRIDAIDAPEKGMPYYAASKKYLAELCGNRLVHLDIKKTDRYGRFVCRAKLSDGRDISAEMIRKGLAWHYKKYSSDKNLAAIEEKARKNRVGLWQEKSAKAPWEVRKIRRESKKLKNIEKVSNR